MVTGFWYTLSCVVVPCAIGALMYGVFEAWDRKRRRAAPEGSLPVIDYLI